jgi:two-component system, cell cycle sensor histidine kinase and response regulator CckA
VLLIDDEDMIVDIGTRILESLGYKVLTATGGSRGIEIFERNKGRHRSGDSGYDHARFMRS